MNPHTPHPDEGRASADRPATDRPAPNFQTGTSRPERPEPERPAADLPAHGTSRPRTSRHGPARSGLPPGRAAPPPEPPRLYPPGDPNGPLPGRQAAELLRLDPQPGHLPRTRPLDRRRGQRHSPPARRRPPDHPRRPDRPDRLRRNWRSRLRPRLGAAARTRRPHSRPGGRRRAVDGRHDRRPHHLGHRFPQPGHRRLGLGPLRLRRLHLDRLLGGRRHLPRLLPDPTQQDPERSHCHAIALRLQQPGRRRGLCG